MDIGTKWYLCATVFHNVECRFQEGCNIDGGHFENPRDLNALQYYNSHAPSVPDNMAYIPTAAFNFSNPTLSRVSAKSFISWLIYWFWLSLSPLITVWLPLDCCLPIVQTFAWYCLWILTGDFVMFVFVPTLDMEKAGLLWQFFSKRCKNSGY